MKKILTLLLAVGAFIAVNAQTSREEARRVILGNPGGTDSRRGDDRDVIYEDNRNPRYPNSESYPNSRNANIDQINREYDSKINSIRSNPYLTNEEKQRMIYQLEKDRAKRIKEASKYNQRDGKYDDDDRYKKDKKYKSNNGKHKGWSKGKGNKHRDRDDD